MSPVVTVAIDLLVMAVTAYGYRLWLMVGQQEQYRPGRLAALAWVWVRVVPLTAVQAVLVVLLSFGGLFATYTAVVAAVIGLFATPAFDKGWGAAPLDRNPRLRRLSALTLGLHVVAGVVLSLLGAISLLPLLTLPIAELALLVTRPLEARRAATTHGAAAPGTDEEPRPAVRRQDDGPTVVDDTAHGFPGATLEDAVRALALARSLAAADGTVWTITPGLFGVVDRAADNVELGRVASQGERSELYVVGRTHSRQLRTGAVDSPGVVETFLHPAEALAQVTAKAAPGDVVLLEGALPPHYP